MQLRDSKQITDIINTALSLNKDDKSTFLSEKSLDTNFTNSQFIFNRFSSGYNLSQDNAFDKLCQDLKQFAGEGFYEDLMENLTKLREQKVSAIKMSSPKYLTHTSTNANIQYLEPRNNLNQFGENRDNFVFATDSSTERDFYSIRSVDEKGKNINWKRTCIQDGERKNVFIIEKSNEESFSYFVPSSKFTPVVCLDGRFGHEWTANETIKPERREQNNIAEIKNRNLVYFVKRDVFINKLNEDPNFMLELNNPNTIINAIENSECLRENNSIKDRINHLKSHFKKPPLKKEENNMQLDKSSLKLDVEMMKKFMENQNN